MNFNNPRRNDSTITMHVMCAIVFCVFSFLYLYYFQADVLAATQHVLSDGMTHYSRMVGAILITLFLYILQLGVFSLTRLTKRSHALTYFPSCVLLAFVTDLHPDVNNHIGIGSWIWVLPLLLVIYVCLVFFAREFQPYEPNNSSYGFFSRWMWINMFTMIVLLFFVGVVGNGNDLFHYRMRAESCLLKGNYQCALEVGEKSEATDSCLTMMRIYALSREGQLGEHLFEYPLIGGSDVLTPTDHSKLVMYPEDSIYRYLGARPKRKFKPMYYLKLLRLHHLAKKPVADYILCGYLLDRNVDSFVCELPRYYKIDEHLPKHYREALTLYTHLRTNPKLVFHNNVMDTDFQDFSDMQKKYSDPMERKYNIDETFGNTYWYYYFYRK